MLKAYKVELNPTKKQSQKIDQSIGNCRWLYNQYLATNIELYQQFKDGLIEKKDSFMGANKFDKHINNNIKILEEYNWINLCGSKARKEAIVNAETAFKNFFKGKSGFPKFKKKNRQDTKIYFPLNNKTDIEAKNDKVKIPTLQWVKIKEKEYVPIGAKFKSVTVSKKGNRYFASILVDETLIEKHTVMTKPIGIDLGIKDFAVVSDEKVFKNINKTKRVKKLKRKLKIEQRKLSRKYESLKIRKKLEKGDATRQNINKQIAKVQKYHIALTNIRTDYINKTISKIIEREPISITIEDLNVKGMMKNKHLSKAVAEQKFFEFREKLTKKCKKIGIELRVVSPWYPSSKTCNVCKNINKDLKLSDRIYKCECGYKNDRDLNAAYNLRDAKIYKVAK